LINLRAIDDPGFSEAIRGEADALAAKAATECKNILVIIEQRLAAM
jgi:hypothetical protein